MLGSGVSPFEDVQTLAEFHQRASAHGLLSGEPRFMQLEIDITTKCNIRCRMCYFSFDRYFYGAPVHLSPDTFSNIADTLLPHARTLTLSLGSEPLTSPSFIPILEIAARHGVPNITFFTNGLLLSDRVIDAVISHGVTQIAISIDGATKETYEYIRRGGDFNQLIGNIRRLVARRTTAGRSTPSLRFGVVMMKSNVHELVDIVLLASALGVTEINFFHMVVYEGLDTEGESLVHHQALSNDWLARALRCANTFGIKVTSAPLPFPIEPGEAPTARPHETGAFADSPYCLFPFFHVSMNSGGHVLACPFSHGEPAWGTVSPEMPFERIWFGPKFTELRTRILNHDPPAMCRRCSYLASKHPGIADLFAPRASN